MTLVIRKGLLVKQARVLSHARRPLHPSPWVYIPRFDLDDMRQLDALAVAGIDVSAVFHIGMKKPALVVTPGSNSFSTPGNDAFVTPNYNTFQAEFWGAGGGAAASAIGENGTAGTASHSSVTLGLTANGGANGNRVTPNNNPGVGGTGVGGTTNTTGQTGEAGGSGTNNQIGGKGGDCLGTGGGTGGAARTDNTNGNYPGNAGNAPGGGGGSGRNVNGGSNSNWYPAGGGGGYTTKTWTPGAGGAPAFGSTIFFTVGTGGAGAVGGTITSGTGANGRAKFTWT